MAIKKQGDFNSTFKVIASIDGALDQNVIGFSEKYSEYLETNNESILPFVEGEQPTRFVMRKTLPMSAHETIMQKQVSIGDDMKPRINLSYTLEEVRCSLVGIENPANLPEDQKIVFHLDSDGFASRELIAQLHEAGIINQLFSARQSFVQKAQHVSKKK